MLAEDERTGTIREELDLPRFEEPQRLASARPIVTCGVS
jgi:hypothetical protein